MEEENKPIRKRGRKIRRKYERVNSKPKRKTDVTTGKTRKSAPKANYRSSRDYDFLQYIRLIYKWALSNYDLTRGELELLLYLYPKGTFSRLTFNSYHKTYSIYQSKTFDKFITDGWLILWRPKKSRQNALYSLSNKAKMLCDRLHKMCTGEVNIPESPVSNNLAKEGGDRINNYYMEMIKKMNKDRDKKG